MSDFVTCAILEIYPPLYHYKKIHNLFFYFKNQTYMKRLLFFALLALASFSSCKDDPKPTPVNPCEGKTSFKADFDICESTLDSLYVTDTIANFEVWIRTTGNYDDVKITVGDDPRVFTSRTFKLDLNDSEIGKTISVKMIGSKKKSNDCFPNEKTIDSLTKSFVVVCSRNWVCANAYPSVEFPFVGKFKGFNADEPAKEFVVTIVNFGPNPRQSSSIPWDVQIYNLPNGCGGTRANNFCGDGLITGQNLWALPGKNVGFRSFRSSSVPDDGSGSGKCCGNVLMWGYVSPSDRNAVTIWHRKYDKTNPRKFVGKRI